MTQTSSDTPTLSTRTTVHVEQGITLPWQRVELYGPILREDGTSTFDNRQPKGTVLETGHVFIFIETLEDLCKAGPDSPVRVGYYQGLALEQNEYASHTIQRNLMYTTMSQRSRLQPVLDQLRKAMKNQNLQEEYVQTTQPIISQNGDKPTGIVQSLWDTTPGDTFTTKYSVALLDCETHVRNKETWIPYNQAIRTAHELNKTNPHNQQGTP